MFMVKDDGPAIESQRGRSWRRFWPAPSSPAREVVPQWFVKSCPEGRGIRSRFRYPTDGCGQYPAPFRRRVAPAPFARTQYGWPVGCEYLSTKGLEMVGISLRKIAIIAAGLVLAAAAEAADSRPAQEAAGRAARVLREISRTAHVVGTQSREPRRAACFANPAANPWTRDNETVSRIEKGRAARGRQRAEADTRSEYGDRRLVAPVGRRRRASALDALRTESGGTRLRFGISASGAACRGLVPSSLWPRRVQLRCQGRLATSFESTAAKLPPRCFLRRTRARRGRSRSSAASRSSPSPGSRASSSARRSIAESSGSSPGSSAGRPQRPAPARMSRSARSISKAS